MNSAMEKQKDISILWRNLRYESKEYSLPLFRRVTKPILRRLSGAFEYHTLSGLMGPSGAGKSTLLNCLSGRGQGQGLSTDSEIYFTRDSSKVITYFIEQSAHENIVGCLTVGEIFRYAFAFKNGGKLRSNEMDEHILRIVHQLMFDGAVLNRRFDQCSGGEQKRIAIGQELMALELKSVILFVDEPTTGLDSASSVQVINCLKQLTAHYRMCVIASIHVPSEEILHAFDRLYVLAKGGVCVYSGMPRDIKSSLQQQLPELAISERQLPIEVLIRIACNGTSDSSVMKLSQHFVEQEFAKSSIHISQLNDKLHPPQIRSKQFSFTDLFLQLSRQFRITFISQYRTQLTLIGLYLFYFVLLATVYNSEMATASSCMPVADKINETCKAVLDNEIRYKENVSYLSYVTMYVGMVVVCCSAVFYSLGVKTLRSEHRNYWYSVGVFYWSTALISIMEMLLYGIFVSTLAYFITFQDGVPEYFQPNWPRLSLYIFFTCFLYLHAQSTGQLIGVIFVGQQDYAIIFSVVYYTLVFMVNGIFVDTEHSANLLVQLGSSVVTLKFVTFGAILAIYGLGRCDPQTEFSFILQFYGIYETQVWNYIWYSAIYVGCVQVMTLTIMSWRFRDSKRKNNKSIDSQQVQLIGIDREDTNSSEGDLVEIPLESSAQSIQSPKLNSTILGWSNLTLYSSSSIYELGIANLTEKREPILRNLNGCIKFGSLNALMGTSGAGKTTLLRVLNGQQRTQISDATSFFISKVCKIQTCFITQEVSDHLWNGLTAKQLLIYSSRLKNQELSAPEHDKIVHGLLEELDLLGTVDTKVEQCSGGEKKRLALALELTSKVMPNLICIDEPTSGLDSNSAEIVLTCLRQLTRAHSLTIIASIHQPNSIQLSMFDQLYVLARGGVCIYAGSPDEIQECLGEVPESDSKSNSPIEQLIKYSCVGHHDSTVQKLVDHQNEMFANSKRDTMKLETHCTADSVACNRKRFTLYSTYILSVRYLAYIWGHLWKEHLFYLVNYLTFAYILIWFYDRAMFDITGCIDLSEDDLESTTQCAQNKDTIDETNLLLNNSKYNFFVGIFYLFFILVQNALSFRRELVYFENEHRNGWYSSGSFYMMKSIIEIAPLLPMNLIYVYLCDYYEHIHPGLYWKMFFFLTISAIGFQAMAHVCAILCAKSVNSLIAVLITLFIFSTMLSNFFILYSRLHYFYQFLTYFTISKYFYESLMLLQYGFGRCGPKEIQGTLYVMGLVDEDLRTCAWMLLFNLIVFRVVALVLLSSKVNPLSNRKQRATQIVKYRNEVLKMGKLNNAALGSSVQQFSIVTTST